MKKGLLYFAQNSAFQHLTKIGKTTKLDVEDRALSGSNVPEDFDYLAVLKCDDIDNVERKVHEQFKEYRHYRRDKSTQKKRITEFFWSGCTDEAIKYAKDLKGVYDSTDNETEEIKIIGEAGKTRTARTPQTTFEMIKLPKGETIYFRDDKKISAVVVDNKNKVNYKGHDFPISTLAIKLDKEQGGNSNNLNGFRYFTYKGKSLWEMRPDQQEKR